MTTPKRPSLADTLARIDATLAEQPPRCTLTGHRRDVGSTGPFTAERCTHDALPGTDRCSLHTEPGEYLLGLPLDVRPRGGITENGQVLPWSPYLQPALDEVARQSAEQLAATAERVNAKAIVPPIPEMGRGWLARALRRLFTSEDR